MCQACGSRQCAATHPTPLCPCGVCLPPSETAPAALLWGVPSVYSGEQCCDMSVMLSFHHSHQGPPMASFWCAAQVSLVKLPTRRHGAATTTEPLCLCSDKRTASVLDSHVRPPPPPSVTLAAPNSTEFWCSSRPRWLRPRRRDAVCSGQPARWHQKRSQRRRRRHRHCRWRHAVCDRQPAGRRAHCNPDHGSGQERQHPTHGSSPHDG